MSVGVYIKGMEMPVTCCHCPLMVFAPDIEWNDGGRETQGAYICVMTNEVINNTKRNEHCPLVPVPPHGRLIDADETARKDNDDFQKIMEMVGPLIVFGAALEDAHTAIQEILKDAPTVIPAEEGEE